MWNISSQEVFRPELISANKVTRVLLLSLVIFFLLFKCTSFLFRDFFSLAFVVVRKHFRLQNLCTF